MEPDSPSKIAVDGNDPPDTVSEEDIPEAEYQELVRSMEEKKKEDQRNQV